MIKIVATRTAIAKKNYPSKTIVNLFNLSYLIAALVVIKLQHNLLDQLYLYAQILLFLLGARIVLAKLQKICGTCKKPLPKNDRILCPRCDSYNVYDIHKWSKRKFDKIESVHRAERNMVLLEITAAIFALLILASPVIFVLLFPHEIVPLLKKIDFLNQYLQ